MKTGRGMGICPLDPVDENFEPEQDIKTVEGDKIPAQSGMRKGYGRSTGISPGGKPRGCGRGFCSGRMRKGLI